MLVVELLVDRAYATGVAFRVTHLVDVFDPPPVDPGEKSGERLRRPVEAERIRRGFLRIEIVLIAHRFAVDELVGAEDPEERGVRAAWAQRGRNRARGGRGRRERRCEA